MYPAIASWIWAQSMEEVYVGSVVVSSYARSIMWSHFNTSYLYGSTEPPPSPIPQFSVRPLMVNSAHTLTIMMKKMHQTF